MSSDLIEFLKIKPLTSGPYNDKREPLVQRIFRILNRSNFRSAPLSDDTLEFIRKHITEKVKSSQPIVFVYPMGGGKGINTYNFPGVSWGEFLHIKFLVENLYPIGEIYEPGIEIKWSLDDYAARIMNNYKAEWQEQYASGLDALLDYFNKLCDGKIKQTRIPTDTWYKFDKLRERVFKDAKARLNTAEGKDIVANWSKRANNNFYNTDQLKGAELQQAIEFSTLLNMAWLDYDFEVRGEFFASGIPIAHFTAFPDCFYIQTLPGCITQFWKGNGYIEEADGVFKSRIATREVWKQIEPKLDFIDNPLDAQLPMLGKLPVLRNA